MAKFAKAIALTICLLVTASARAGAAWRVTPSMQAPLALGVAPDGSSWALMSVPPFPATLIQRTYPNGSAVIYDGPLGGCTYKGAPLTLTPHGAYLAENYDCRFQSYAVEFIGYDYNSFLHGMTLPIVVPGPTEITAIQVDRRGNIWVIRGDGTLGEVLSAGGYVDRTPPDTLAVISIRFDSLGGLWATTTAPGRDSRGHVDYLPSR